ncbi:hypothetical protein BDV19DRAFT_362415 [Aspergillus venezuelensis]
MTCTSSARGMHLKRRCYDRPRLCCRLANHQRTPHPIPLRSWAASLTASRSKVLPHACGQLVNKRGPKKYSPRPSSFSHPLASRSSLGSTYGSWL